MTIGAFELQKAGVPEWIFFNPFCSHVCVCEREIKDDCVTLNTRGSHGTSPFLDYIVLLSRN